MAIFGLDEGLPVFIVVEVVRATLGINRAIYFTEQRTERLWTAFLGLCFLLRKLAKDCWEFSETSQKTEVCQTGLEANE